MWIFQSHFFQPTQSNNIIIVKYMWEGITRVVASPIPWPSCPTKLTKMHFILTINNGKWLVVHSFYIKRNSMILCTVQFGRARKGEQRKIAKLRVLCRKKWLFLTPIADFVGPPYNWFRAPLEAGPLGTCLKCLMGDQALVVVLILLRTTYTVKSPIYIRYMHRCM